MTETKTKSGSHAATKKPRNAPKQIMDAAAGKARESVKRSATKTRESTTQAANPNTDADESPQRYAESRIAESTEYAVDRLKPSSRGTRSRTDPKRTVKKEPDSATIRDPGRDLTARETKDASALRERNPPSHLEARNPIAHEPLRGEANELFRPKVREYPVEISRKTVTVSPVELKEPKLRSEGFTQVEALAIKEVRTQLTKSDVIHERMEPTPFRKPQRDMKELLRDASKERVRDVPSCSEPKLAAMEPSTAQTQHRQLAIDKFRQAVRERKETNPNRDSISPDAVHAEPATNTPPSQTSPSAYTDSTPIRAAEQTPSSRSKKMRFHENAHTPRGMREGRSIKEANRAVSGMEKSSKATIKTTDKSIKTAERSIKTTEYGIKTGAKSAEATAKTAQKTAQATAKAAQTSAKTAQAAAKAAARAAKTAAQAIARIMNYIVAAAKELIAAIAAGGWLAVLLVAIVAILAVVLCLCFGVFSSNDAAEGRPMTEAIQEINGDFVSSIDAKINRFKRRHKPDEVILVYEGDTDSDGSVMNWQGVLGIYAVSTTTDPDHPTDVLTVSRDKIETLRSIFKQMNSVSYDTDLEAEEIPSVDGYGYPIFDDEGNPVTEEKKTLTITITVSSLDYRDAAELYGFTDDQKEMLREMMRPEYYPLFAELTGDVIGDGGEFGFGLDINPDLPPNELGYQIVQAAKRYIGRSYASMDCSTLCRTAYQDCGLTSMNGLSSVRMAQKCQEMGCLFTDASQLQAGDLIFFASYDPSRGKDYCRDRRRCGDGKCRRWMHIHHVAIYINDQYLIDSTGGDNSVQIRKLYGQNSSTLKWVCFGRPTT